jgi:hypothetical protein
MKSLKITVTSLTLMLLLIMGLDSCKKPAEFFDQINPGSGDKNRKTTVKIAGAENDINIVALNVTPTIEEIVLIELTRDASTEADLGSALTVKLVKNATLIADYNTTNGTSLIELPSAAYSFLEDISNISFAPGDFTKTVKLRLDKSKLDLSEQYALGISIAELGSGAAISAGNGNVLYNILVKNKYDGVYSYVSGLVTRYTSPGVPANDALSGPLGPNNPDVEFATVGANTVEIIGLTWSGGTLGVGGIAGLTATVDPATNLVTMASSGNATLTNWAGKENKYDPATKTFTLNFRWNPTSTTREYSVVLKYAGPR